MSVEQGDPAVCAASDNTESKGEMTKAPISLRDLRRRIYRKAKVEAAWRFWGLYVHVCKLETLREAYRLVKHNNGAPGIDGVTFAAIEAEGLGAWLQQLRDELSGHRYRPTRPRRVEVPKRSGSKGFRTLSIPTIRDRVVQGALKLILEPTMQSKEHGRKPSTYPARQFSTLLLAGTMETSASFEARSAPSSYPTTNEAVRTAARSDTILNRRPSGRTELFRGGA